MKKLKKKIIFKRNPVLAFLSFHLAGKIKRKRQRKMNQISFLKLKRHLKKLLKKRQLKRKLRKLLMSLPKRNLLKRRKKADFYPDFAAEARKSLKTMKRKSSRKTLMMNL